MVCAEFSSRLLVRLTISLPVPLPLSVRDTLHSLIHRPPLQVKCQHSCFGSSKSASEKSAKKMSLHVTPDLLEESRYSLPNKLFISRNYKNKNLKSLTIIPRAQKGRKSTKLY